MLRKRSSSGWARLAAWLDAPSTRSSLVAFQFNHPPLICDLGAYIDSGMSDTDHVTRLTRTCFFHIRQLRSIRRSLTVDSSHALVRALILTRLDYCNGLLGGAPKCLLSSLSRVLRAAARLILLLPRTSSVENEIRTVLHWLDVPARRNFKLCLLASSVSSWVGSALPDPVLHTSQLYRRTLTSPFGRHGHGVCAWLADINNWNSGVHRLLSDCMEQSPGLIFVITGSVF